MKIYSIKYRFTKKRYVCASSMLEAKNIFEYFDFNTDSMKECTKELFSLAKNEIEIQQLNDILESKQSGLVRYNGIFGSKIGHKFRLYPLDKIGYGKPKPRKILPRTRMLTKTKIKTPRRYGEKPSIY